jgi:DNA-binding response OmpR family regulator
MHVELPDLVILNPGPEFFDGLLDRQLRADSLTKNVPVLIVASPVALENLETKPDPDLILAKPVMLDVLEARVDRLLRNVPAPHADLLALGAA